MRERLLQSMWKIEIENSIQAMVIHLSMPVPNQASHPTSLSSLCIVRTAGELRRQAASMAGVNDESANKH